MQKNNSILESARIAEQTHAYPFHEGNEPPLAKCPRCGEIAEQDENGKDFCRECYPIAPHEKEKP